MRDCINTWKWYLLFELCCISTIRKNIFIFSLYQACTDPKSPLLTHWGRGHLNCLNARSQGLNNLNQLLYCVSLKIYNKFANYICELKFSRNTHQDPSSAWGCDTSGNIPPCGAALSRTCRCTEFHFFFIEKKIFVSATVTSDHFNPLEPVKYFSWFCK